MDACSPEEQVARTILEQGKFDCLVVVCDATCLERNLNLVLQTMEISNRVVVCVNLLDEAKRKHIRIDLAQLSNKLGVPVVGTVARKKNSLAALLHALDGVRRHRRSLITPPAPRQTTSSVRPAPSPWRSKKIA